MEFKYDKIGVDYNSTRHADPFITSRLIHHLRPSTEDKYLDIGCGTGNYTIALSKPGYTFIGMDPSKIMLSEAKARNSDVDWRFGSAEDTGMSDLSIDGIIASLTIHHWTNLHKAFSELHRILKNAGKIIIFTATRSQMQGYWLNHYFPNMLQDSMEQMPSFEQVEMAMNWSGFSIQHSESYFIQPDLKDLFLYSGKYNPTIYLNSAVRSGISSFSDLANSEEVEVGLAQLELDISSGKFKEVSRSYENETGDYLFIIGEKLGL